MPIKIMLDSNAIDSLKSLSLGNIQQDKFEFYVSVTQIEEIASMPDAKKEERILNLITYAQLRPIMVLSSVCVPGHARFDLARLGDGEVFDKIINEKGSNVSDAIIADTAVCEGCILVTNDERLYKKMVNNNYQAMLFSDFKIELEKVTNLVEE